MTLQLKFSPIQGFLVLWLDLPGIRKIQFAQKSAYVKEMIPCITCQVIPGNIHLWKTVLFRKQRKVPKLVKLITTFCKVPAFVNVHSVSVMTVNKTEVSGLAECPVIVG